MKKLLLYLSPLFLAVSCMEISGVDLYPDCRPGSPVTVGLCLGDGVKSVAGDDGLSTSWLPEDRIAVWALNSAGSFQLEAQPFATYGTDAARAWFTSELSSEMPAGSYTYYISYPEPLSHNGTLAEYEIPSVQDGLAGGGADIMFSAPIVWTELKSLDKTSIDHSEMAASVNHATHRFRFYTEASGSLSGEPVQKIEVEFPKPVAGRVKYNLASASSAPEILSAVKTITAQMDTPVQISDAYGRHYAMISAIPFQSGDADVLKVKLYTSHYVAKASIPTNGRNFAAGHSTPVKVTPSSVAEYFTINFRINSNNLGETLESVKLTAPEGCGWSDNGGSTYVYAPAGGLDAGASFTLVFEDEKAFRAFSGKSISVTYDSEHVTIGETVSFADLSGKTSANLSLNVPYLLYEDFSAVQSFSSNDAYTSSSVGSKDAYSFLNGWTGGRIGAEAGHSIRVAAHEETGLFIPVSYPARVDSAPLNGTLKKSANLLLEFDYGANSESLNDWGDLPQRCHIGYVTSTKAYKSGDTDGTFEHSFDIQEYSGTWTFLPNHGTYVLSNVGAGSVTRISFRTEVLTSSSIGTNTTSWLYLDNIKVKISK